MRYFYLLFLFLAACQSSFDSKETTAGRLAREDKNQGVYSIGQVDGQISASPQTCLIPAGASLCSSIISWTSQGASDVKVKIEGHLFAASPSGSSEAPWISENPATFELWTDGILIDSVTVVGIRGPKGTLSANPEVCTLGTNGLCSSTISWTTVGVSDVKVKIQGLLFAGGLSGSSVAPWIGEGPAVFELWGDNVLLATKTVIGKKADVPVPTPTPVPITLGPDDCRATDSTSLMSCYRDVLQKKYKNIAIMNDISCSGERACYLFFNNFQGPAKIFGYNPGGKNRVIHRKDHFDYSLIQIFASSDIEIRDIDFQEGAVNKPAGLFKTPEYDKNSSCDVPQHLCSATIDMNLDSNRITLDHISILESKYNGIQVGNLNDFTIKNSTIRHSWSNGLWTTSGEDPVPNAHVPKNIRIENNTFIDNRCSAIEMSAMGNSVVIGNYLSHNHMGSIFHVPGGQFAIEGRTNGLLVKDNEITNGKIDEDPVLASQGWLTVAFEFTDSHVHNVTLDHNYFHNNTGGGIIHDPSPTGRVDFGPITVLNNVFNNPGGSGTDFMGWDPGELILGNNCSGPQCVYQK